MGGDLSVLLSLRADFRSDGLECGLMDLPGTATGGEIRLTVPRHDSSLGGQAETLVGPAHSSVAIDTPAITAARFISEPPPQAPSPAANLPKLLGFCSSN
jgi:hypothetical protein